MSKIKEKVEAVLFLSGRMLDIEEIKRFCRAKDEEVRQSLNELKKEFDEKGSGIKLVNDGNLWKFSVSDEYLPIAKKIGTETELSKSVLETLAVIAFKYPVLQADVIKIRTNKAYMHMEELEKAGFISRQKHSRTSLIKLTDKFFNYFDLRPEKLKEKFKDFEGLAKAISEKEKGIEEIKEKGRRGSEEQKKEEEKIKKEIEKLDEAEDDYKVPLQVYKSEKGDASKDKLGDLEVIDEPEQKKSEEENEDKI